MCVDNFHLARNWVILILPGFSIEKPFERMKRALYPILFIAAAVGASLEAMAQRNCGATEHHAMLLQNDPNYGENQSRIEEFTQRFLAENGHLAQRGVITIPVVVHVVYNTAAQNISDAQIMSQINILNADFRKLNADVSQTPSVFTSVVADPEIQFCLATVDPNGNATTGIVRKSTTVTSFSTNDNVKYSSTGGSNAWPASSYLNLWVCNLGSGLLGYAQFPGGAAATDGVVCTYTAFGNTGTATAPFNKGRTATHEIGHWLNLRHIWGDATCGSDLVSDTPTHNAANYGCPTYPHYSTCTGTPVEMTMNYMDYTDDACMYMFTAGQKARMSALFAPGGARVGLLTSNGCGTVTPPTACGVPTGLSTASITTSSATLSWAAVSGATSYDVQFRQTGTTTYTTGNVTSTSASLTGLLAGTSYEWSVRANCTGGSSAYSSNVSFATTAAVTCTNDSYETNETMATAKSLSVNTTYSAMKICSGDVDWFKFSNTSGQKHIRVRLTSVPADFDLQLYNASGTLLGTSQNGGTTPEGIYYNNAPVGTYYAKVYGYNGAFSNTAYTIRCERASSAYTSARLDGSDDELIAESAQQLSINLFPNPANDVLNVNVNGSNADLITINVYDMSGRMVLSANSPYSADGVTHHLDMSGLKFGLYQVEVTCGAERVSQRVLRN